VPALGATPQVLATVQNTAVVLVLNVPTAQAVHTRFCDCEGTTLWYCPVVQAAGVQGRHEVALTVVL